MRRFALILTVLCLAMPARAQTPLFDDFKAFCADTGDDPGAIARAVEAAGGVQHGMPGATDFPWPMTTRSWDHRVGAQSLTVSAGSMHTPKVPSAPEQNSTSCIVTTFANDDSSVAALRKWVGVPAADVSSGSPTIYHFSFQLKDGRHMDLPSDARAQRALEAKGMVWMLVVLRSSNGASVQLAHVLPASP